LLCQRNGNYFEIENRTIERTQKKKNSQCESEIMRTALSNETTNWQTAHLVNKIKHNQVN